MNSKLLQLISPFPFIDIQSNVLYDGQEILQPTLCKKKCISRSCCMTNTHREHNVCPQSFSFYNFNYNGYQFVVNGIIVADLNKEMDPYKKKVYFNNRVNSSKIIAFDEYYNSIIELVNSMIQTHVLEIISPLHDIKTSLGLVMNNAQAIIHEATGDSFDDKLDNVDSNLKELFLSVNLLNDQMHLLDIITNPDRVCLGKKRLTSIYRLFHKIARLFEHRALKRQINIVMKGKSHNEIYAYNSIQFLPLILLDNAVKYSFGRRDIEVYVSDLNDSVRVEISSYGPVVPPESRVRIFEKYYRCENASMFASEGLGLGLYLAQRVAFAHGFEIQYKCLSHGKNMQTEYGENVFCFVIPYDSISDN